MIEKATAWVERELGAYVFLQTQDQGRVQAGSLYDLDGKIDQSLKGKIVLTVVNVTQELTYRATRTHERRADGTHERVLPPVNINLYLLFTAFMGTYSEAVKAVGQVLAFFQQHPSVPFSSVPGLESLDGRLNFELQSPSFEQVNHMWGSLGAKYMPSALYKVGIVEVRDRKVESETAPIRELQTRPALEGAA